MHGTNVAEFVSGMNRDGHSKGAPWPGPVREARHCATLALAVALMLAPQAGWSDPDDALPDSTQFRRSGRDTIPAPLEPVRAGESLRFNVRWKFISAGDAWLEVPEVRDWNGHPAWVLVARAQSNGFIDKFYKVRNRIESVWDQRARFSWRYFEDRHEGGYTANDTLTFEPDSGRVRYQDGKTYPVPPNVQDALSAFYYTRFQPLTIGSIVAFDYHASRRTAPMEVKVLGRQRIKVPAGTFDCVIVEPMLRVGGIFKNKGRLLIWLTDDDRRFPVLMKSKVVIGSIDVALTELRPGG